MLGTWPSSPSCARALSLQLIAGCVRMPWGDGPGADGLDDAGGDPSAHPEYDLDLVDDDAGGGGDDPPRQPAAPAGRQPVQAPARPGQPAAGAPGQDGGTPQAYTPEQYNQVVTGYRTLERQHQQTQGQVALLQRQIAALTGQQPPAADPAGDQPPLSEADQKAIKAVYRLFPQLKPLLEKAKDLLAMPDALSGMQQGEQARGQAVATRMWEAFDNAVKTSYQGRQLHKFAQSALDASFTNWLETDPNAAARYRLGDTSLAAEFVKMYRNAVIGPAQAGAPSIPGAPRRPGQPQQPARVPRGGPGATVVGQRPGQPNVQKPEEVHDAAAEAFFTARG